MINIDNFKYNQKILMLALDHRGSFQKLLPNLSKAELEKQILEIKKMIIDSQYENYSGILLDPEFGLKSYTKDKPFLLCIEKSGYDSNSEGKPCKLENSVEELKKMGAYGIKILIFLNPKSTSLSQKIELLKQVNANCHKNNLPFFLEFLTYPVNGLDYNLEKAILESLKIILDNGIFPDVFKLEYPGNAQTCNQITKKLNGIPWILLTKGVNFPTFKNSLKVAIGEGAAGFLAGRSLWQDFIDYPRVGWRQFFERTVKQRFNQINKIALSI